MIIVDNKTCTGCGACIEDCLFQSLQLQDGHPVLIGGCIQCGHCVAVCPPQAIVIPECDMADVEACDPTANALNTEQLLRAIKSRRSIRNYQGRSIETKVLEHILQAGRYTATAVNRQQNRFIVVQEGLPRLKAMIWDGLEKALALPKDKQPTGIETYREHYNRHQQNPTDDFLFRNAPAVLFIATKVTIDAGLTAQNMELTAVSQGLGVLYNGYLLRAASMNPAVLDWFETTDRPLAVCMLLGYPDVSYLRTAPRRPADVVWK